MEFFALYFIFEVIEGISYVFCRTLSKNQKVIRLHENFGFLKVGEGTINGKEFVR